MCIEAWHEQVVRTEDTGVISWIQELSYDYQCDGIDCSTTYTSTEQVPTQNVQLVNREAKDL